MFDFLKFLMFAAINDAEEEERARQEELQNKETKCEPEINNWEEPEPRETKESERDWCRREREQLEWEMRNADFYHYDKEDIEQKMKYLEDKEKEIE